MKKVLLFPDQKLKLVIEAHSDADNPRTWDNLGKCIFFHSRYNFGDKHDIDANDYNNFAEMAKDLRKNHDAVVVLPVYMYDHSGQTIRTTPFGDRWDSGQLGFIIATREAIKASYGGKIVTKQKRERAEQHLKGEIETLDQYLTGDVYGFTLNTFDPAVNDADDDGDFKDSCWGFYGDTTDNGIFDHMPNEITKEAYEAAFKAANWEYEHSY